MIKKLFFRPVGYTRKNRPGWRQTNIFLNLALPPHFNDLRLKRNWIITFQFIKQHTIIKLRHSNAYIKSQSKVHNFLYSMILPRGTLENIFKVESLAHLKVEGKYKKLVIVKTSVKYEMKYIKLPPNFHFITLCDWFRLTSKCLGVMREVSHDFFFCKINFKKFLNPRTSN